MDGMSVPYLVANPPRRPQYRSPRRAKLTGAIVVHTAENTPDYVAFDGGAEAVANFIANRTDAGSYHDLVDSDSAIQLVRYDDEAFHDGTGGNRWSLGVSVATRADVWPLAPQVWRDGAVEQAARAAARQATHVHQRTGVVVPAARITAAQYRAGAAGFVSHGELDPGRRTDPGAGFPWAQFLARFTVHRDRLLGFAPDPGDLTMSEAAKIRAEMAAADAKLRADVAKMDRLLAEQMRKRDALIVGWTKDRLGATDADVADLERRLSDLEGDG